MSVDGTPVREVRSARQVLLDTGRRLEASVVRDRPRAIDRYIDYFGGPLHRPPAPWLVVASPRREIAGAS
jgi:hypothetical protein